MYLGKPREALEILEASAAERKEAEDAFTVASALIGIGESRLALGDTEGAVQAAQEAITASDSEAVLYPAARIFLASDRQEAATEIANQLDNKLQSQTTAAAGLIRGEQALVEGRLGEALRELRASSEEVDLWFSSYLMGRAYFEAGHYPEAFDELDACVRRQGEVTDVFLVDGATLRYFPEALYWLARASEALGQTDAATELFQRYVDLRGEADPADPLAEAARSRLEP
jgi:tetratricopeptide (TPR) repeat protein